MNAFPATDDSRHQPPDTFAAIDLGSNSFHMLVTRTSGNRLLKMDRLKDMVQLAYGLDENNDLSEEAQQKALDCLGRFRQRLDAIADSHVRAVGTNTMRRANNSREFLRKAEQALGYPIEIISGREEARLIYLGVAHHVASQDQPRQLVIDIGGGSTEFMIGSGFSMYFLESLHVGCVNTAKRFQLSKQFTLKNMQRAAQLAAHRLIPVKQALKKQGWQRVIGASGTIKTVHSVMQQEQWCQDHITQDAMEKLWRFLPGKSTTDIGQRWSLTPQRAQVLASGFSVLYGICQTLDLKQIEIAAGALREGLIYDLLGRNKSATGTRFTTVDDMMRRYQVDFSQANRVAQTAHKLLQQVKDAWSLDESTCSHHLLWAAHLHEVGLAIAHHQYHRHSDYLVAHSDLPGFSQTEQQWIATLIRYHRRGLKLRAFEHLAKPQIALRLCVLLRLSCLLHRGRLPDNSSLEQLQLRVHKNRLHLHLGQPLADHPLTEFDLAEESQRLENMGLQFSYD